MQNHIHFSGSELFLTKFWLMLPYEKVITILFHRITWYMGSLCDIPHFLANVI